MTNQAIKEVFAKERYTLFVIGGSAPKGNILCKKRVR
jgi:hypothetical protein